MNPQLQQPQQLRHPWLTTLLLLSTKIEALSPPACALQQSRCASGATSRQNWKRNSFDAFPSKRPISSAGVHRRIPNNIYCSSRLYISQDDENNDNNSTNQNDANGTSKPANRSSSEKQSSNNNKNSLLNMINPYKAGKSLRSTVESAIDLASAITSPSPASRLSPERRAIYYNYYLDDKLGLSTSELKDSTPRPAIASEWLSSSDTDTRPEVLVVGATGELGQVLVKRLLLENKVRVRVLVRDLYSSTINKLGTGVTYCQGDLANMESLEYAVTDLDKIVFCAGHDSSTRATDHNNDVNDLAQRSQQAEKVDSHGLRNLVHAYLNVRHADYGTSQTAKRVLFKFRSASADFGLFDVEESIDIVGSADLRYRSTQASHAQKCIWKENKFSHGIFTGQVTRQGEASVASVRLRSRNDPNEGLDLQSSGFAGFVCRLCSNGGVYESFLRTEAYERLGVEYVCEFKTASKSPNMLNDDNNNTSRDKFCTVRLDFSDFRPRMRPDAIDKVKQRALLNLSDIPRFVGKDVRQIGFRYRGENNSPIRSSAPSSIASSNWSKFYLALDYIKLYRSQPEPEFVYLSDARIPPVLQDGMIRDDIHRLESTSTTPNIDIDLSAMVGRSAEETYFKYKGEEIIKQSGLR
eukprot:scaffold15879_cov80-Cyclotella_meneghiniana.AAC.9